MVYVTVYIFDIFLKSKFFSSLPIFPKLSVLKTLLGLLSIFLKVLVLSSKMDRLKVVAFDRYLLNGEAQ